MVLHGVNGIGHESGNEAMCAGRDLAWLQDAEGVDVWSDWRIDYRDVVIVDATGHAVAVYNLTENDLADEGSYAALSELLLDAR